MLHMFDNFSANIRTFDPNSDLRIGSQLKGNFCKLSIFAAGKKVTKVVVSIFHPPALLPFIPRGKQQ